MTTTTPLSEGHGACGVTIFYRVLALLLAVFFTGIAAVSLAVWVKNGHAASLISIAAPIWIAYAVLCFFLIRKAADTNWAAAAVFLLAFLPRIVLVFVHTYSPTSDYWNYWQMGQAFLQGDSPMIALQVDQYRVFEFSGLAVLWGVMQWITGGSALGFQCLQCMITAGIAVMVYLLGSKADKRIGLTAAILYALYPSNLVMSQVFSNQHLATLLALCAILLYLRGMEARGFPKRVLYGALAGLTLLVSHYSYPASIITRIAFAVYALLLCFQCRKQILQILCVLAACLVVFSAGEALTDRALLAGGYRLAETERFHQTERILTGLAAESDGQLDQQLRDVYRAMSDDEAHAAIREKLKNPAALVKLFARKALIMWGSMDSTFTWYTHEANETSTTLAVSDALGALDVVYVAAVYLLAATGLFLRRNALGVLGLPAIITAGWIGVYLIYEIQMRYRYYAMPLLMVFAALGVAALLARRKKEAV
jgi:hypothetical protein